MDLCHRDTLLGHDRVLVIGFGFGRCLTLQRSIDVYELFGLGPAERALEGVFFLVDELGALDVDHHVAARHDDAVGRRAQTDQTQLLLALIALEVEDVDQVVGLAPHLSLLPNHRGCERGTGFVLAHYL